jgi:hypothetical protein
MWLVDVRQPNRRQALQGSDSRQNYFNLGQREDKTADFLPDGVS